MWRDEVIEEHQKVAMGNYTQAEVTKSCKMWEEALQSAMGSGRTKVGPRGAVMVKVKYGDYESSFEETAETSEVEVTAAAKKETECLSSQRSGGCISDKGCELLWLALRNCSDLRR